MRYYTKEGKEYKSVTSILSEMFPFSKELTPIPWKMYEDKVKDLGLTVDHVEKLSKAMGTKVSDWIDNARKGLSEFDPPAIGWREEGLRLAVNKFLSNYDLLDTEHTVYCNEFKYAGTYDMKFIEKGKSLLSKRPILGDAKTFGAWDRKPYERNSNKLKKAGIQVSMYAYADGDTSWIFNRRAVVVFKVDGTYDVEFRKGFDNQWQEYLYKIMMEQNENID